MLQKHEFLESKTKCRTRNEGYKNEAATKSAKIAELEELLNQQASRNLAETVAPVEITSESKKTKTVLIAENNEDTLQIMGQVLSKEGYSVNSVRDGVVLFDKDQLSSKEKVEGNQLSVV